MMKNWYCHVRNCRQTDEQVGYTWCVFVPHCAHSSLFSITPIQGSCFATDSLRRTASPPSAHCTDPPSLKIKISSLSCYLRAHSRELNDALSLDKPDIALLQCERPWVSCCTKCAFFRIMQLSANMVQIETRWENVCSSCHTPDHFLWPQTEFLTGIIS